MRYCIKCKTKSKIVYRVSQKNKGGLFNINIYCTNCGNDISDLPELYTNMYNHVNLVLTAKELNK